MIHQIGQTKGWPTCANNHLQMSIRKRACRIGYGKFSQWNHGRRARKGKRDTKFFAGRENRPHSSPSPLAPPSNCHATHYYKGCGSCGLLLEHSFKNTHSLGLLLCCNTAPHPVSVIVVLYISILFLC